jgi:competence protein ComEC
MRFPILWIAAAFAAGIGLSCILPATSLSQWLFLCAVVLGAALGLLRAGWLRAAWGVSLTLWMALGAASFRLQALEVPAHHVTRLLGNGQFDDTQALRWQGTLRSDPVRLPYGLRYEMELSGVEIAGRAQPVTGGLRVSYFGNAQQPEPEPALRAGDRVEALLRARPPRNFQNPGAFDVRAHLARLDIHLVGSLRSLELIRRLDAPAPLRASPSARLRGHLLERIEALFHAQPEHAAVLRAILLGDYSFVDHDLAETFQKTAAYHVLVISGLHVAALAAFVFWLGRRLRFSYLLNSLVTLAALAGFVAIVEDRPPIERAALMTLLVLSAGLLFRRVALLNTLGAAVLLMLAAQPGALLDPSFQLSFLAGAMIAALALPLVDRTSAPYRKAVAHLSDITRDAGHSPRVTQLRLDLRAASAWLEARSPRLLQRPLAGVPAPCLRAALRVWDVFVVSTVIQLGMLPLLAHYFHRVSLAGPLANIPAAVLSALLVPVGFLTLLTDAAIPLLSEAFAAATSALTAMLLACVRYFAAWQSLSYRIPGPPLGLAAALWGALLALSWTFHSAAGRGRRALLLLTPPLALLAATAICTFPFSPALSRGHLQLTVLDVGQGDALFLAFPDGQTMLLDGGGPFGAARSGGFRTGIDIGEQVVSNYLWSRGLKRMDVLALSHAHQDHLEGLRAVMENFDVGELWVSREIRSAGFARLLEAARAHGISVKYPTRGETFTLGGVRGLVLWPERPAPADAASNNDSLVLRLEFGAHTFLLPGDIEADVEQELFRRNDSLSADFLKVAHHASRSSTTTNFALAVLPRVALMSLGETNPFGHPHTQVVETLRAIGAQAYRTDRDGAITITSDGRHFALRTHSIQE